MVRILIIDDSATIRKTAEKYLRESGYDVLTAGEPIEAFAIAYDYPPDLVLLDIMMPLMDGYQACGILRSTEQFSSVPVVMLTSKDGVLDKARCQVAGATAYLTKPFTKEEIIQSVNQFTE